MTTSQDADRAAHRDIRQYLDELDRRGLLRRVARPNQQGHRSDAPGALAVPQSGQQMVVGLTAQAGDRANALAAAIV
jgi:hypothetical protein